MSGGKRKDQLQCPRGVTCRVTQSHKVLFCRAQGNGFGPGYVFLFNRVTPGNLPLEVPANLRETVMYLHHGVASCFPSLASYCAPGAVRAVLLPGKEGWGIFRSSPRRPAQQIVFLELSAPRRHFLRPIYTVKKKKKKAFKAIILQNKNDTQRYNKV